MEYTAQMVPKFTLVLEGKEARWLRALIQHSIPEGALNVGDPRFNRNLRKKFLEALTIKP